MKKLISLLCVLALFLCLFAMPVGASEDHYIYEGGYKTIEVFLNGGTLYFADRGDSVALFDSRGLSGDVVIPETVNGKPVTALVYFNCSPGLVYNPCLSENRGITSITLPSTLKELEDVEETETCFFSSDTLKRIEFLGDGPEVFPMRTFSECKNLEEIIFPRKAREVSDSLNYSFLNPPNLKKIVVPSDSLYLSMDDQGIIYNKDKTVLVSAAQGAQERTEVVIPDTVKKMSSQSFSDNVNLKKVTFLGDGPESLGGSFADCKNLEEVILPKQVKEIGGLMNENLTKLRNVVIDLANQYLTKDDQGIVYSKDKTRLIATFLAEELTELKLPDTIREIEINAFVRNPNLQKIIGGEKVVGKTLSHAGSPELNPYSDTYGHWSEKSVKWAYQKEIAGGVAPCRFQPDGKLSRAMFVTFLRRTAEIKGGYYSPCFVDVSFKSYYRDAVGWAREYEVTNGVGGNRFAPEQNVTREQMAAMIYRYVQKEKETKHYASSIDEVGYRIDYNADAKGDVSVFEDANRISSYAEEAMSWAVGAGILQGKNGGRLDPKGTATRAEAVTMMQRLQSIKKIITPAE